MSEQTPFPLPESPFWQAIEDGRLTFQRCAACGHAWLPDRQACPSCWTMESRRETASGRAKVVSWVVYHVAFHPAFEGRLPYNVAIVELAEGPRMVSNLVNLEGWSGAIADAPVELVIQEQFGRRIPRFRLVGQAPKDQPQEAEQRPFHQPKTPREKMPC